MTTLELARKLDQCLAAQVKLQKERDAAIDRLRIMVDVFNQPKPDHMVAFAAIELAYAVLAQVKDA